MTHRAFTACPDQSGSWGQGDFDGAMQAILAPASAGTFTKKRSVTLGKRLAWRYEYSIDQAHSDWQLSHLNIYGGMYNYEPAFGGAIWIDQETSGVLRFEMEARNLPDTFPMDKVQWAIDYDFVKVGNGNYLSPNTPGWIIARGTLTDVPETLPNFRITKNIAPTPTSRSRKQNRARTIATDLL